jgi:hypothetical protein
MVKKISVVVLAGLLAWPAAAFAASTDQLEQRIEELTRELNQLKAQMQEVKDNNEEMSDQFEEKSEKWDQASRFQFSGDFRSRLDYVRTETPAYYSAFDVADTLVANAAAAGQIAALQNFFALPPDQRAAALPGFGPFLAGVPITPAKVYQNDTDLTNRLRLNMRVKVLENVEFKGRLAMYKAWGMQNNPLIQEPFGPYTLNSLSFDGNVTRQPGSSALYVDRAFVNWNNIAGLPIWFSIGRRPTTDGPPEQLRLGADERLATPIAYMDYPFDGISMGYAYRSLFGLGDAPGRIRFCWGRGFQTAGNINGAGINDVDFAGFSWDMYKKGNRFLYLQTFGAFNIFNVPDNVTFPNPYETALVQLGQDQIADVIDLAHIQAGNANGILDRANLGNIWHTSAIYMDKWQNLNYFVAGGWSHTDPHGWDEAGNSLLTSNWGSLDSKDGYSVYVGGRYDLDDYGLKFGLEYNHGSKDWISFTPGNDDLYQSKLAARGNVYEAYMIWDIPGGEAISRYAKAFMRFGYQYYQYNYSGSGFWLPAPVKVDDTTASPMNAQLYAPTKNQNQVYVTFEAWF